MSSISELQERAHRTAQDHGFTDATFGERIALVHSELSETLEYYRTAGLDVQHEYDVMDFVEAMQADGNAADADFTSIAAELADVVIRVLDMAGAYGLDLERAILLKMNYNDTRPYRHGGKRL